MTARAILVFAGLSAIAFAPGLCGRATKAGSKFLLLNDLYRRIPRASFVIQLHGTSTSTELNRSDRAPTKQTPSQKQRDFLYTYHPHLIFSEFTKNTKHKLPLLKNRRLAGETGPGDVKSRPFPLSWQDKQALQTKSVLLKEDSSRKKANNTAQPVPRSRTRFASFAPQPVRVVKPTRKLHSGNTEVLSRKGRKFKRISDFRTKHGKVGRELYSKPKKHSTANQDAGFKSSSEVDKEPGTSFDIYEDSIELQNDNESGLQMLETELVPFQSGNNSHLVPIFAVPPRTRVTHRETKPIFKSRARLYDGSVSDGVIKRSIPRHTVDSTRSDRETREIAELMAIRESLEFLQNGRNRGRSSKNRRTSKVSTTAIRQSTALATTTITSGIKYSDENDYPPIESHPLL